MVLATVLATVRLVEMVVTAQGGIAPVDLIRAGTGIWITNVIAFAILYWEIDLGGPARRSLSGS